MNELKERERLAKCKTDKERWEFFLGYNGEDLSIECDNSYEITTVISKEDTSYGVEFDSYLTEDTYTKSLIDVLEVKVEWYPL